MTRADLLLTKLMEECGETIQRAAKCLQFGPNESQSKAPRGLGGNNPPEGTNLERLQAEFSDLCAVGQIFGLRFPTREEVANKYLKIVRYEEYSKELGRVYTVAPRGLMPEFKGAVCKGSYALGTACGNCERCSWLMGEAL